MPTLPFFCGKDCGGNACPLLATVQAGRVTRVTNNPAAGKFLKGCPRGFEMPLQQNAPDRILTPLIRTGERGSGQFRQASWDEALTLTANKLGEIREAYGPSAVMSRGGAGDTGVLHGTGGLLNRFLNLYGGATRLTGSYSSGAADFVLPYVLGDDWRESGFDAATMQYSQMIIMWGANVLETRQGTEVPQRLLEARRCGKQIVVIDPRHTATVKHAATWWLPCRPGTDAALMLAVLYVLFAEDLADRPFMAAHCVGFDQLERYVSGADGGVARSPAWAAPICGISPDEITRFARAYASAKPAMLFPGYSIQRVFAGEEPYRLSVALQVVTGNFGQKGGSTGSINSRLSGPRVGRLPAAATGAEPSLPEVRWPDAILQGRSGGYPSDIRAIYVLGSNAINQGGDIRKSMAAFAKLDFAVTHEFFLTLTARHCDVIFPAATHFEKEDIGRPWAGNYLLYRPQIVALAGQARTDYDALCDLADRLGFGDKFSEGRTAAQWLQRFIEESEISDPDEFRRTGIYLGADQERSGLADFARDPLGHPLSTPSGKVEIASQAYRQTGFPAIPIWQQPPEDGRFPLRLITPKSPHYTHSQSHLPEIRRKARHALEMHPTDAAARGITDGEMVRIYNARGEIRVAARVSDDLMPGVVSLHEGIWAELNGNGVDVAGAANMLTATDGTLPGTQCIMHAVSVQVAAVQQRD
jgi:anaerobic dimethyl sulfoxide reductase subunit A